MSMKGKMAFVIYFFRHESIIKIKQTCTSRLVSSLKSINTHFSLVKKHVHKLNLFYTVISSTLYDIKLFLSDRIILVPL